MFPTPVGMNRRFFVRLLFFFYVPHTRGDEPHDRTLEFWAVKCSPHPWG